MIPNDPGSDLEPRWVDVVMKTLPRMYVAGDLRGNDEFVYATTFFSVGIELGRGATAQAIRLQRSRILRSIDETDRPDHDKEQFASVFARAVDDALEGRPPSLLH